MEVRLVLHKQHTFEEGRKTARKLGTFLLERSSCLVMTRRSGSGDCAAEEEVADSINDPSGYLPGEDEKEKLPCARH